MQTLSIVFQQVCIMFLLIFTGMTLRRKEIVTERAAKECSNILLLIITPSVILHSYDREFHMDELKKLILAFVLSLLFNIIAVIVSKILIRKNENTGYQIQRMATVYGNCGFMAFPILLAVIGPIGVFYGSAFVGVFNIFLWTHAIKLLNPDEKLNIRKCFFNPGMISVMIGLLIYIARIPLPYVISETLKMLADLNTPFSMLVIGVFLGMIKWTETIKDFSLYKASALRIVLLPMIFLAVTFLTRLNLVMPGAKEVCVSMILCASCPVAVAVVLMAARMDLDGEYGAKFISISTLFSIITLPIITTAAQLIL